MLDEILGKDSYALCLTPGFFRFYAHIGILHALDDAGCLRVSHLAGSSAGALVAAFLASGMSPADMADRVLAIGRTDVWDVGGFGGLLKGELFRSKLAEHLPVQTIEEAKIPISVTAFDLLRLRTTCIVEGSLAQAARASCTFPGLFQPAIVNGRPHIDGGVWDHVGLMALGSCFRADLARRGESATQPLAPDSKLIVNVVFDTPRGSYLPEEFPNCRLLTIVVENIPGVNPFTMSTEGPRAYRVARAATARALHSAHIIEISPNHWCCFVDGALVAADSLEAPQALASPTSTATAAPALAAEELRESEEPPQPNVPAADVASLSGDGPSEADQPSPSPSPSSAAGEAAGGVETQERAPLPPPIARVPSYSFVRGDSLGRQLLSPSSVAAVSPTAAAKKRKLEPGAGQEGEQDQPPKHTKGD